MSVFAIQFAAHRIGLFCADAVTGRFVFAWSFHVVRDLFAFRHARVSECVLLAIKFTAHRIGLFCADAVTRRLLRLSVTWSFHVVRDLSQDFAMQGFPNVCFPYHSIFRVAGSNTSGHGGIALLFWRSPWHIKPSYRKLLQHVPHGFDMNIMPSLMPQAMS